MFIETTPESAAEGALAEWYASQRDSWGFLPDYAGCFAASKVLDALGARLDPETASTFDGDALAGMIVGRPVGDA